MRVIESLREHWTAIINKATWEYFNMLATHMVGPVCTG